MVGVNWSPRIVSPPEGERKVFALRQVKRGGGAVARSFVLFPGPRRLILSSSSQDWVRFAQFPQGRPASHLSLRPFDKKMKIKSVILDSLLRAFFWIGLV